MQPSKNLAPIELDIPGWGHVLIKNLVLDFTGTLSCDGKLLEGVANRLIKLAQHLSITVLTADTFGSAAGQLEGLPLDLHLIRSSKDKVAFMEGLNLAETVAIGNGRNDVEMIRMAGIGIAVIRPEACAGQLLAAADIICADILAGLDLLRTPLRIVATLRE